MNYLTIFIEDNEYRETETATVIQAFHQYCTLLLLNLISRLTRIVVHMDIFKVLVNDFADCGIIRDEVCKTQTPGTPVATHLTNNELSFRRSLGNGLVYLLYGVDGLVVYLL